MIVYQHRSFITLIILCIIILHGCALQSKKIEVKKEKIGAVEIAYMTRGQGAPLVMIMGLRGTMAMWDPALLEILEKKYTLILFDNRGIGLSTDTNREQLTIAQMADDTAQLITALGYQKAHVLGWSMGSRIALDLSLKYPEKVQSLILCSPNPGGGHQAPRTSDAFRKLTEQKLTEKEGLSLIFPNTPQGNAASAAYIIRLTEALIKGTIPYDVTVTENALRRQVEAVRLWNRTSQSYKLLPEIKIPTLVAGGLADIVDPPENVGIIASRIPFAWTAYFPESGHNFLSQNYKLFADLIMVFTEANR